MLKINEYFYHLKGKDLFVNKNHSHNEIELIQVINGSGMVLKNDKSYIFEVSTSMSLTQEMHI